MKNAHNEVSRASVVTALEDEPSLRHLAWHTATCLAPKAGLESRGRIWGEACDGGSQGDPEAGPQFNVAWQKDVRVLDYRVSVSQGMARFGNDDGYVVGPPGVVFPAVQAFADNVQANHGLRLQPSKCEIFSWSGEMPPEAPREMIPGGVRVNDRFFPGILVYGIPVGSDEYVRHML